MRRPASEFRPFAPRARRTIVAILLTFALVSALSAALSIWTTGHSRHRATLLEVAARQRTLAERYVAEVELARNGQQADPGRCNSWLSGCPADLICCGCARCC